MDTVFIGNKDIKNYIVAGMQSLSKHGSVKILARGKYCQKAIDVAEILKRNTNKTSEVIIGSEKHNNRYVSTIEIIIK